jgi:hypothetical protein
MEPAKDTHGMMSEAPPFGSRPGGRRVASYAHHSRALRMNSPIIQPARRISLPHSAPRGGSRGGIILRNLWLTVKVDDVVLAYIHRLSAKQLLISDLGRTHQSRGCACSQSQPLPALRGQAQLARARRALPPLRGMVRDTFDHDRFACNELNNCWGGK